MRPDVLLKRYFSVAVLGLIGVAAYFQASGVSQFASGRLAVSPSALAAMPADPSSMPNESTSATLHSTDGTPILERNAFDSVTGPLSESAETSMQDGEPVGRADFSHPYQAPDCTDDTKVVIIAAATDPEWSMAALGGGAIGGEPQMRRIGDRVGSKELWHVAWDRVWLHGNGELCQVRMFVPDSKPAATQTKAPAAPTPTKPARGTGPPPVPPDIASKIEKVSDTEFNVDRSVVDNILENQAALMRSARIVPERKDGKVVGIRLFRVQPDTLLGTLGLKNGDRLESINGFDMTSPEKALEAYARLRTAEHLTVSVNRGGKPVNIDFNIK